MSEFGWSNPLLVVRGGVKYAALPIGTYNNLLKEAGIDAEIVDVPKKLPEVKHKPKKVIDKGKIKALHEAGWSVYDIARDMNLSISTIYNNLPPLRK